MSFEYMITTEEIREKIFNNFYSKSQDIGIVEYYLDTDFYNLADGVYDRESGIFITRFFMIVKMIFAFIL